MKLIAQILFFLSFTLVAQAQIADSAVPAQNDSGKPQIQTPAIDTARIDTAITAKDSTDVVSTVQGAKFDKREGFKNNRFYHVFTKGEYKIEKFASGQRKDWLFYLITGLLFFLAVLRLSYLKYFNNLFRLFFRTTLRQTQLRDQLLQSQLSSMLFNFFFFLSAGTYLFLLIRYYDVTITTGKWKELGICMGLVAVLYMTKYSVLKATGWVLGIKPAIETYTFIVFLVNKVLGVLLVPFIVLLAFASNSISKVALTLSLLMVMGMFVYRFIRSYLPIQNEIKVSRFHFFLYLCAFEITPLLLIYKVLLKYF